MNRKFLSFDEMSADELWEHNRLEYESSNIISEYLINKFYLALFKSINSISKNNFDILEVGCGTAESSKRIFNNLESLGIEYNFEASEFDQRFVKKINELNFPFKVIQESVYELKRPDKSFDLVLLLEVLEHLEDYELAIKEISRVSKGFFIISVPNEPLWRLLNMCRLKYLKDLGNTPGHINHFNKTKLVKLISKYADVIEVKNPLPWLILLAKVK